MEISNLPHKEFKVMVIKVLTKIRRKDEHSDNLKKKNIRKYKTKVTQLKNTIIEENYIRCVQ